MHVNGKELAVEIDGPEGAPVVLLMHGLGGTSNFNSSSWAFSSMAWMAQDEDLDLSLAVSERAWSTIQLSSFATIW